jgi:hypothetical protein
MLRVPSPLSLSFSSFVFRQVKAGRKKKDKDKEKEKEERKRTLPRDISYSLMLRGGQFW